MPDIRIVSPGRHNHWQPGSDEMISFRVLEDEHPGDPAFRVSLHRGPFEAAERIATIDPSGVSYHAGADSYSFRWRVPSDVPTGDDYFIEVVDRRTPTGTNGEHFSVIGPIDAVTGGGTRYVSNPTRINWRVHDGAPIARVDIRLMHCQRFMHEGEETRTDIREVVRIAREVSARRPRSNRGRYEWRVGANRRDGANWIFDPAMGDQWDDFPWEGFYFYRVSDSANPDTYCDGPVFSIRLPIIEVWTERLDDDEGRIITWDSENLVDLSSPGYEEYRAKVVIEGRYDNGHGRFVSDRDPGNASYFCIRTGWFRPKRMTWRWGESVPYPGDERTMYPDVCQLPAQCSIKVSVPGFRWIARGVSLTFQLPCNGAPDPVWVGHW